MNDADIEVRNVTYRLFVELGAAPTSHDVAAATGSDVSMVAATWSRLHDAHALVLHPQTGELRMANPFAAAPTEYSVDVGGRQWYANCAWDAFGICAALHSDGVITTTCAECGDAIECGVSAKQPSDPTLLFHCLVPAAQWWDDIVFT